MNAQQPSLIDLILDCKDFEEFSYLKSINRYVFQSDYKYNNNNASFFIKYATFELDCTHNMSRFRHNMELILNSNITTWLNYINMEMKYNNINHAHNLFTRYIDKYLNNLNDLNTIFLHFLQFIYMTGLFKTVDMRDFFQLWKSKIIQLSSSQVTDDEANRFLNFYYKVYIKFLHEYLDDNQEEILALFIEWFAHTLSFDAWLSFEHEKLISLKEKTATEICKLRSIYSLIMDHLYKVNNINKLRKALVKYVDFEFSNKEHDIAKFAISKWHSIHKNDENWQMLLSNSDFANDYKKFEIIRRHYNKASDDDNITSTHSIQDDCTFGILDYDKSSNMAFNKRQIVCFNEMRQHYIGNICKLPYEESLTFWSNYVRFLKDDKNTKIFIEILGLLKVKVNDYTTKSKDLKIYIFIKKAYLKYLETINDPDVNTKWDDFIAEIKDNSHLKFKNLWLDYLVFIKSSSPQNYNMILSEITTFYGKPSLFKALAELLYKDNNFDMLRVVYKQLILYNPLQSSSWSLLFDLEMLLQDNPRTRNLAHKIIDLFSTTDETDFVHTTFKKCVEYESDNGEYSYVRHNLYYAHFQDPISKSPVLTDSVQNWIDYAYWEFKSPTNKQLELLQDVDSDDEVELEITEDNVKNARQIFEVSLKHFQPVFQKRYQMYQQYLSFETKYGKDETFLQRLRDRKPVNNEFPEDKIKKEDQDLEENNKLDDLFSAVENWEG